MCNITSLRMRLRCLCEHEHPPVRALNKHTPNSVPVSLYLRCYRLMAKIASKRYCNGFIKVNHSRFMAVIACYFNLIACISDCALLYVLYDFIVHI